MSIFKKNVILFLCLLSVILSAAVFGQEADNIVERQIIANDGEVIIYKHYNDNRYPASRQLVALYNSSGDCLLAKLPFVNYKTVSLTKIKDYENVTLYELAITYAYSRRNNIIPRNDAELTSYNYHGNDYKKFIPKDGDTVTERVKIWIDKNNGTYSGSVTYTPEDLSVLSLEGTEYYTAIQDVLLDLVNEEFDGFSKDFENEEPHETDYFFETIFKWVTTYDDDASALKDRYNALRMEQYIQIFQYFKRGNKPLNYITERQIIADDGEIVIYRLHNEIVSAERFVELYNSSGDRLLARFPNVNEETLSLTKIKDYENVTLYELAITYVYHRWYHIIDKSYEILTIENYKKFIPKEGDTITERIKVWVDKNDGIYSGSLMYTPIDLTVSSFEGYEYYAVIQDVLLDLVNEEFDNFAKDFQNNELHETDYFFDKIFNWVTMYDESADKLKDRLQALKSDDFQIHAERAKKGVNRLYLSQFTSPISVIQKLPFVQMKGLQERPDIEGDFPKNEQELDIYTTWIIKLHGKQDDNIPYDAYGTPIRFEILDDGLKAISAGADKEFDTDDDIVYINGIEIQMELK